MKILLVMDPGIPIPPKGYGGIERIVALLAEEYLKLGHQVHILASEGSAIKGCTMHSIGKDGFPPSGKEMRKAIFAAWAYIWKNRSQFDLIHNFGRLLYLLPVLGHPVKKIMCYQREISRRNIQIINKMPTANLIFSGCSNDLVRRANTPGKWVAIHNAVDFSQFKLTIELPHDAPLIFLGRIERIKGCHTAIQIAKATHNRLIIAGNISSLPEEKAYFENEIKPHIDGQQIEYVGTVNDEQKNHYLGQSKALLFPIEWNEPFGIVMIEAMACGTPVIGFNRGSVPEVVKDGVNGFIIDNEQEMIQAIFNLNKISREQCRAYSCQKFDIPVIAEVYLNL